MGKGGNIYGVHRVAMPDGDPLLVNLVQNFIASLMGSGDLKMTERWFNDGSWLKELP